MRPQARQLARIVLRTATVGLAFVLGALAQQDPPSRVARLNYIGGNASIQPAGAADWGAAEINQPLTTGDTLATDVNSQLEAHTDIAVIRAGSQTTFGLLNLDDQTVQLRVTEGDLSVHLRQFQSNQTLEVDTPNAAVTLLRDGDYRFRIGSNGDMSFIVARSGSAEVTGGGQAVTLNAGNSVRIDGTTQLVFDVQPMPPADDFDNWCAARNAREARLASARYLPPTVIGYEDLDSYGRWEPAADYGPVWYPRVEAGWVPYHTGHWAWVEPWGWTWIDAAPWGFAPFHYGRWAWIGNRWGWCPGPVAVAGYRGPVVRPYYAPALVAWFGGSHWSVSISSGAPGPSLGWVALGVGEVYTPAYHCSRPYFSNVNVYNTHITRTVNVTNVYETVYVHKTVYNQTFVNVRAPNAVVAMREAEFANGRAVRQNAVIVRGPELARLQPSAAAVLAPGVAPQRTAFVGGGEHAGFRPPVRAAERQVVVVHRPPAGLAPVAERQAYLQQHAAEPHNFEAMHQQANAVAPRVQAAPPVVRQVAPQPAAAVRQQGPALRAQPVPAARIQNSPPPQVEPAQQPGSPAPAQQAVRHDERMHPNPPVAQPPAPNVQPTPAARVQPPPTAPRVEARREEQAHERPQAHPQPPPPAAPQPQPAPQVRAQEPPPQHHEAGPQGQHPGNPAARREEAPQTLPHVDHPRENNPHNDDKAHNNDKPHSNNK